MSIVSELLEGKDIRNTIENHSLIENTTPKFTVEQLIDVYEGVLEVHNNQGLLYTLPLPHETVVDYELMDKVRSTLNLPIRSLVREEDCLVAYI